jgi:DNA polymerase-3 subunit delta
MAKVFGVQNVFDLLEATVPDKLPHILAIVGNDRFLKRLALSHLLSEEAREDLVRYTAEERPWSEIREDLDTATLFGGGPKLVLVDEADVWTKHTAVLEYAQRGVSRGAMILDMLSLPANTNLYKAIAAQGWLIKCGPPVKDARSQKPDVQRLNTWLGNRAQQQHDIKLSRDALRTLVDLIGWEFGMLDQELAKLALFVERGAAATPELVRQVVGGWRTETTWEMLEAVADGDAAVGLRQLDQLLQAGATPQALFGSIAWFLRRFNAATRLVERQERQGKRPHLESALLKAGFRMESVKQADRQIKQLTRHRAGELFERLLDVDLALKGSHSSLDRGRWKLENLILSLARRPRPNA